MELYEEIKIDREAGARRLVAEYRSRLQSAAQLLCNDAAEAEDLVFRAFEQAIKKIDEFRPTGSFYYWIYTILLNFHRMDLRKRAIRPQVTRNGEIPDREDTGSNPFDAFLFRGSAEAVRTAVHRLPDNFREVVVLRYFEEMSTGEIAKVTGLNEGTVKSRLHYAKEALYAMLSDTELSPDFTERLIRRTRPRGWLFRRGWVASLLLALGLTGLAGVGVGVAVSSGVSSSSGGAGESTLAENGLWQVRGAGSTFSHEADAIDRSIESGLKYLVSQQKPDGSFPGNFGASSALPSLVGMAILSKGHLPDAEPYGKTLTACLDYVLTTADLEEKASFKGYMGRAGNGRMYAHAIATLFLSEMSGMVDPARQAKIDTVLPLAVKVIVDAQKQSKDVAHAGGWRYEPTSRDSDLSCSGWALMALRSARLNGMELPEDSISKAVLYIKRMRRASDGAFGYQGNHGQYAETLTGAAILCLELCGHHLDPDSLQAARFVEKTYRQSLVNGSHPFYGLYYTSQGLFQLGGETWRGFESWMYETYAKRQRSDGSWVGGGDESNPVYATAMTVLAFTVPYRMLPIYQRDETVDADEERKDEK